MNALPENAGVLTQMSPDLYLRPQMWKCVKCHEKVDNNFEVCWNCGTSREGIEDPEFRPADQIPADELESDPRSPKPESVLDVSTAIRAHSDDADLDLEIGEKAALL